MIQNLIEALTLAGIFSIAAMGLYLLVGLTGQISIAQATYMGFGALFSSYLGRSSGLSAVLPGKAMPFPQALIITTLLTGLVCAFFGFLFIKLRGPAAISASIASAVLILYILERLTFISGGSRGASASRSLIFGNTDFANLPINGGLSREAGLLILVLIFLGIVYLYVRNVSISPLGRAMRTVRERDSAAQTCAISPTKTIVSAYFLCGLTAGLAGTFYAQYLQSLEVSSSNPWLGPFGIVASMQILAYLVVSGMKTLNRSVIIVFLLSFVSVFFARSARTLEIFDSSQGSNISPSQITAIVTALLVLGSLVFIAKARKKHA